MFKIQIKEITVKKYRIVCALEIFGDKYSNTKLKEQILKDFPSLKFHKCKNAKGLPFKDALGDTSIPHILEHMIIDNQSQYTNDVLFGTTQWINEECGISKIELSYTDDIVCLRAIKQSVEKLNSYSNYC